MLTAEQHATLIEVLERARNQGAIGPGPVEKHVDQAFALAKLIECAPVRFVDLGSGAGLPGLVLSLAWQRAGGTLLEAQARRCGLLERALEALGLAGRVMVAHGRAEEVARAHEHREAYDLVVARAFGSPAVTAECATAFLRVGGTLAVTEPPEEDPSRWPKEGLQRLGLGAPVGRRLGDTAAVFIPKQHPTDARWPRATGIPAKRPLW